MKVKLELTDSFTAHEVVVEMSPADYKRLVDMLESGYDVGIEYADPM